MCTWNNSTHELNRKYTNPDPGSILIKDISEDFKCCSLSFCRLFCVSPFSSHLSFSLCSCLPLAFMADLISLLCLCALRGSPLPSAITLTRFTLALRSGSVGELWALCSEPDGVLEGDTDWLVGQPVSSIVDRYTDSNSARTGSAGQAVDTSRQSVRAQGSARGCHLTDSTTAFTMACLFQKVVINWGLYCDLSCVLTHTCTCTRTVHTLTQTVGEHT